MKWRLLALKDVGAIYTGSTPRTGEQNFYNGEFPFVTPADLGKSEPIVDTPRTITEAGAAVSRLLPKDAVLVCCIGSLGKVGIAGRSLATNQQINAVVFDPTKIFPRYGYYACVGLKKQLDVSASATTVPIVNKSRFAELKIPCPPLSEQVRIAGVLDKVADLHQKRRFALNKLEQLGSQVFLDMFGDPRANSKNWETCMIGEVAAVSTGSTPPTSDPRNFDGGVPFATPSDLQGLITVTSRTISEQGRQHTKTARKGSSLVGCIGDIGRIGFATVETSFNQQINAVEWHGAVDDVFGYVLLRQLRFVFKHAAVQAVLPILNKRRFAAIPIPVPPINAQRKFAAFMHQLWRNEFMFNLQQNRIAQLEKSLNSVLVGVERAS